jgi:hypothetical protein
MQMHHNVMRSPETDQGDITAQQPFELPTRTYVNDRQTPMVYISNPPMPMVHNFMHSPETDREFRRQLNELHNELLRQLIERSQLHDNISTEGIAPEVGVERNSCCCTIN